MCTTACCGFCQDESIEGWSIVRTVDGKDKDPYTLDEKFSSIKSGAKITVREHDCSYPFTV